MACTGLSGEIADRTHNDESAEEMHNLKLGKIDSPLHIVELAPMVT